MTEEYLEILTAVQEGDIDLLRTLVNISDSSSSTITAISSSSSSKYDRNKMILLNQVDDNNCTLLHWAAINNRIEITHFLIDYGLIHAISGGILQETPLQWALRKKYYRMMNIIYSRTQCNLYHKSIHGYDVLHLACRLGDVYGVFLLLSWGVNPDTIDNNGDTPILSLLKDRSSNNNEVSVKTKNDLIKLLIKFGAGAEIANQIDGNTPLHYIMKDKGYGIDASIAFTIYQAAGSKCRLVRNKDGLSPHSLAVSVNNRDQATFLFHALLFEFLPFNCPTVLSAAVVLAFFYLTTSFGLFYGIIYWIIITGISVCFFQLPIIDHQKRLVSGIFYGFLIALFISYYQYISSHIYLYINYITLFFVMMSILFIYRFTNKKPISMNKMENRSKLASLIIESSPVEGTDEEAELYAKMSIDNNINNNSSSRSISSSNSSSSSSSNSSSDNHSYKYRGRTLGPKLCTTCVCNRRGVIKHYSTSLVLPQFCGLVWCCLPTIKKNKKNKSSGSNSNSNNSSNDDNDHDVGDNSDVSLLLRHDKKSKSGISINSSSSNSSSSSSNNSKSSSNDDDVDNDDRNNSNSININNNLKNSSSTTEVISIATHCSNCDLCVIDQDHHCIYLNNCVGIGNRRLFWALLFFTSSFLCIYFLSSKYLHHTYYCPDDNNNNIHNIYFIPKSMKAYIIYWIPTSFILYYFEFFDVFFGKELYVFQNYPGFYGLSCISFILGCYLAALLQVQAVCIARETTFMNVSKSRYELRVPAPRRRTRNLLSFLYSGLYNVTYPKQADHTNKQHDDHNNNNNNSIRNEKDDYENAMKLLNTIDEEIATTTSTTTTGDAQKCPFIHSVKKTKNQVSGQGKNRNLTTAYTAPWENDDNDDKSRLLLSSSITSTTAKKCHDKHCNHCDDDDDVYETDYDVEYVQSKENNYSEHYFLDSDHENNSSSSSYGSRGSSSSSGSNNSSSSRGSSKGNNGISGNNGTKSNSIQVVKANKSQNNTFSIIDADERV